MMHKTAPVRKVGQGSFLHAVRLMAVAVGALTAVQAGLSAGSPPRTTVDWLKKAMRARISVSYRAIETVTVKSGRKAQEQKLRVVHKKPNSTSWTYLSGRGQVERIVVDSNHSHWQYIPRRQQIIFSPSLPTDQDVWQERYLGRLLSNYTVRDAGISTIEGRRARLLVIAPKKGHEGPAKKMWVDEATGLVVRSELTCSDGGATVTSALTGLRIEKRIHASEFAPPRAKKQTVIYEHAAVLPLGSLARHWKHPLLVPEGMLSGYTLESARLLRRGKRDFVHLRYSDGFNVVSLFEDASNGRKPPPRGGSSDRVHGDPVTWDSYPTFHSLTWREQGLKLTLIGDLPKPQMLKIANSVKRFAR